MLAFGFIVPFVLVGIRTAKIFLAQDDFEWSTFFAQLAICGLCAVAIVILVGAL